LFIEFSKLVTSLKSNKCILKQKKTRAVHLCPFWHCRPGYDGRNSSERWESIPDCKTVLTLLLLLILIIIVLRKSFY